MQFLEKHSHAYKTYLFSYQYHIKNNSISAMDISQLKNNEPFTKVQIIAFIKEEVF